MIKFRIYPEDRALYFLIHIYDTKKDLQDKIRAISNGKLDKRIRSGVAPTHESSLLGLIFFWRKDAETMVLTHEFFHATLAWARRVGLDFEKDEERLATVHGQMCAKFVRKCYDKGVYA